MGKSKNTDVSSAFDHFQPASRSAASTGSKYTDGGGVLNAITAANYEGTYAATLEDDRQRAAALGINTAFLDKMIETEKEESIQRERSKTSSKTSSYLQACAVEGYAPAGIQSMCMSIPEPPAKVGCEKLTAARKDAVNFIHQSTSPVKQERYVA